jgi:hypothetical protein
MPNWNQVLAEIDRSPRKDALDYIRLKYQKRLYQKTGRNVICYYSGFMQKPDIRLVYRFIERYLLCGPCAMLTAWLENRLAPN